MGKEDLAVEIDLCLFAAEERGLFGSREWVSKHAKELDKKRTWVLNLDCVGRGEQFFINNGQGTILKKRSDPQIVRLLEEACAELGIQHNLCWGGNTDHYEFVTRRFRCASILRCDVDRAILPERLLRAFFRIPVTRDVIPRLIWLHSKDDTGEHIDMRKLEQTADLVELFVRKLSKEIAQAKSGG
ncbi:M28 family peptidase [Candidatus Acetothermia bacterium]|nr:M28 family peptidase [Candidatus Acetothermia bacterium]